LKEKAKFGIIVLLILTVNIALYEALLIQKYIQSSFTHQWLVYGFIAVLINTLLYTYFLFFKAKEQIKILSNDILVQENKFEKLKNTFQKKVEKEKATSTSKDKVISEQSKLTSMKELINNLSHQWRQPLSIISTVATSLKLEEENGVLLNKKKILEACILVNENAQYLSTTLDNFNEFSNHKQEKKVFKLEHLLHNIFDLTNIFHDTYHIKMGYDLKKDISVYSYKHDLIQVLLNILNNSKETFERRDIKDRIIFIEVDGDKENFFITIKDSAGGMEEAILDRVFEPYFTTKHRSQGVGLGLYLSYVIVTQKLGGEISVRNTTFTSELFDGELNGVEVLIRVPIIG
jgi:signal transduction histidine kinase